MRQVRSRDRQTYRLSACRKQKTVVGDRLTAVNSDIDATLDGKKLTEMRHVDLDHGTVCSQEC
jgi:hypothetical protein